MSVEVRLGEAILDLEGRLIDGMGIDDAIGETAKDHCFKDEVIRLRGAKLLGPLDQVKVKSDRRIAIARDGLALRAAIDAYIVQDVNGSMRDWLISQIGREPSYEELKVAFERSTEAWVIKHKKELED